jgi:hypothetical protein
MNPNTPRESETFSNRNAVISIDANTPRERERERARERERERERARDVDGYQHGKRESETSRDPNTPSQGYLAHNKTSTP